MQACWLHAWQCVSVADCVSRVDTEDKAAVQLDADILEHLVKTLTASHTRKEADIERLADELKHGEVLGHTNMSPVC